MPFLVHARVEAQPFLKWAGGKASLLRQLGEFIPNEIDRYIEPFLGGGAVFSPFSDCDYTRRYHFVEGYCRFWRGLEITATTTKKIRSYDTAFSTKARARQAFQRLFHHFRRSTLVVSYSSNCIPGKSEMIELLKSEKSNVTVYESAHRYHHGNHAHKVGDNKNEVVEYLFVAE